MPTAITAKTFAYLNKALPTLVMEIGEGTYAATPFLNAGTKFKFMKVKPAGRQLECSVRVQKHGTMIDYTGAGYDALPATSQDPSKTYGFDFAAGGCAIRVSGQELRTESAMDSSQLQDNTKSVVEDMMEQFERRIVGGADATYGTSYWTGLTTLNGTTVTTGLFENAAFGSQTNTFGLAKATYPLYWQHQRFDATNFSTGGIKGFIDLCTRIKTAGGSAKFALLSQAYNTLFANDRDGKIHYVAQPVTGEAGAMVAMYQGCALFASPNLGFGAAPYSAMLFDPDALELVVDKASNFSTSELIRVSGQDVYEAVVSHRAQWVAKNLRRMGLLVNADS